MTQYDDRAATLQKMGRATESANGAVYDQAQANKAAVYTREDLILVVSHLSSINEQLIFVRVVLVVLAALSLLSYFGK